MADHIQRLSNTHDDVMNVLCANPFIGLRELSDLTGYSIPWLSRLMNSDMFRARMEVKKGEVFVAVVEDIPGKLNALAHQAVDKLAEKLEVAEDPEFILDTFDKVMHRAGYAPKTGGGTGGVSLTQNNTFLVSREDLQSARTSIFNRGTVPPAIEMGQTEQEIPYDFSNQQETAQGQG